MSTPDAPIAITDLDEITAVGNDDLFVVVDMSVNPPVTKKAKKSNTSPTNPSTNSVKLPFENGGSGTSLAITADKNKIISYTANGASLAVSVSQSLASTEAVDVTLKLTCANAGGTTIAWAGADSGVWANGSVLGATGNELVNGETYFVGFLVGSNGVMGVNWIKIGV